jgi:hypothetical protein
MSYVQEQSGHHAWQQQKIDGDRGRALAAARLGRKEQRATTSPNKL